VDVRRVVPSADVQAEPAHQVGVLSFDFVHGTRDPFGSVEEMEKALQLIPAKTNLLTIEGAGHDLNFKKGAAAGDFIATVVRAFQEFFEEPR